MNVRRRSHRKHCLRLCGILLQCTDSPRTHGSELDHLRKQLAYLKFWQGIVVVTDISLAGWLISSSGSAAAVTVFLAVAGLVLLSAGIVVLHRKIERRIDRMKEL